MQYKYMRFRIGEAKRMQRNGAAVTVDIRAPDIVKSREDLWADIHLPFTVFHRILTTVKDKSDNKKLIIVGDDEKEIASAICYCLSYGYQSLGYVLIDYSRQRKIPRPQRQSSGRRRSSARQRKQPEIIIKKKRSF